MKRAIAVIGANYGDEGKGLIVDFLASQISGDKVVVRFNGGAQAGHTVVTPDGKRHVFSHFGAGTFAGAATYLAKHFVLNPLLFWREGKQLSGLGITPMVAADPRCFVTTPYDILINQLIEDSRGDRRHGSVGVGFGETIERNAYPSFQLWKSDLSDKDKLTEKLHLIRDLWVEIRCEQLRIHHPAKDDHRMSDDILDRTITACGAFDSEVTTAGAEFLEKKSIIFEGAQGLCLDMNSKNFPHVTRSNTGLTNIVPIAKILGLNLDVYYVTRPYLTKHGAGPLPKEYTPDPPIIDETNTAHPYQGTIRFGELDTFALKARIAEDHSIIPSSDHGIALSCADHISASGLDKLRSSLGVVRIISKGPQRDAVQIVS